MLLLMNFLTSNCLTNVKLLDQFRFFSIEFMRVREKGFKNNNEDTDTEKFLLNLYMGGIQIFFN